MRTLDLTAMRALVMVADTGGVTRAASRLNLSQSAVSMQIKRLEDSLGLPLFDREHRQIVPTPRGEELIGYARRMLALNDEAMTRLGQAAQMTEIVFGVPHDIVYPKVPQVLRAFADSFPGVQVRLVSSFTQSLKRDLVAGSADLILTTETQPDAAAERLAHLPLVWVGAPNGSAWMRRPLRLAHETQCGFRKTAQAKLDAAGIAWEMVVDTDSSRTAEATVSADLAVHTMLAGTIPAQFAVIDAPDALPDLGGMFLALYRGARPSNRAQARAIDQLAQMIIQAYRT